MAMSKVEATTDMVEAIKRLPYHQRRRATAVAESVFHDRVTLYRQWGSECGEDDIIAAAGMAAAAEVYYLFKVRGGK